MITNHSYLDNPTFRGMRQSLLKTFNEIYICNLHGNSLKKETCPDGSKDENVFDIQQGVSIAIFIKQENSKKNASVYYFDKYGLREDKYKWLSKNDSEKIKYSKMKSETPWYFLIPTETESIKYYLDWDRIDEIFPINSVGIVTSRDDFVTDLNKTELEKRILQLKNLSHPDDLISQTYKLKDKSNWKLSKVRKEISKLPDYKNYFQEILYRPFDKRSIFYHTSLVERTRDDVMKHMLHENIGLCFMRQYSGNDQYSHFLITENVVDNRTFFSSKGIIQLAPLYLYPDEEKTDLFENNTEKKPNIPEEIFKKLKESYNKKVSPEEILYYIYGIFYSNIYRERYSEFLRIDFPRVPITGDYKLFKIISKLGNKLAGLHLLKSPDLSKSVSKFKGKGDNIRIEKIKYDPEAEIVYINADKYFDGITGDVWNYHMGGYQVLEKYLKDRKGRLMDDPRHYCLMITAIVKTMVIQKEIDTYYEAVEKSPIL